MSQNRKYPIDYSMRYQIRSGRVNFANYVQRRELVQDGRLLGLQTFNPDNDVSIVANIQEGANSTTPAEYDRYIAAVRPTPVIPVTPVGPSGTVYTSPTTNVNTTIVQQSPYGGGGNSYSFNGTSCYLTLPGDSSWAFGTGDFTIEWFQYQTATAGYPRIFAIGAVNTDNGNYSPTSIGCSIENGALIGWFSSANFFLPPRTNNWDHVALVRRNGELTAYINGQLAGVAQGDSNPVPNTTNITDSTTTLYIGVENAGNPDTVSEESYFNGYITNIRIVKDLAVYTGPFTVPTSALTLTAAANPYGGSNTVAIPDGYTKLLLVP
jgi:hypothetical protein